MLIMGAAPILAPLLGSALLLFGDWRLNFWFMAAFGVVIGLAALTRMRESRSEATALQASQENPLQSYLTVLRQRRLIGYALAGALNGATLFTYLSSSPGLIMGTYGMSAALFPWVFWLNAVGIIGGNQVNRFVLRYLTPDQVLARFSLIALAIGVLLTLASFGGFDGPWVILPLLFLLLGSYGFIQGNTMAGALSVDPLRAGAISALMGTVSFAAGSLASMLGGLLHDGTPKPMAGVMVVALAGSAAFLHALALPKRAQA
jgi:DHA1 family bicyclomycin/chloramphenicol resistance-like MFS transporter